MTPRTRNNGRGRLMAAGPVNTTGFPALPVETLYEITEHLSLALVGTPAARSSQSCDYICLRTRTMRSLAETCRRLRSIFLALSFESLEAWGNLDRLCRKKDLARELATQLVRQIEIVTIRNSALAQYVKTVTVSLTTYSAATVYPEFFGCLSVLPNLETLQILCLAESWRNNPFHAALGDRIFPTVRTLLVPQKAFDIIAHYPNIERLTIVDGYILSLRSFLPTIAAMPRLQIFDCRPICSSLEMADIIDCLPLLSEIPDIDIFFVDFEALKRLRMMKNLCHIRLRVPSSETSSGSLSSRVQSLVDAALKVLRTLGANDGVDRSVSLKFLDGVDRKYRA